MCVFHKAEASCLYSLNMLGEHKSRACKLQMNASRGFMCPLKKRSRPQDVFACMQCLSMLQHAPLASDKAGTSYILATWCSSNKPTRTSLYKPTRLLMLCLVSQHHMWQPQLQLTIGKSPHACFGLDCSHTEDGREVSEKSRQRGSRANYAGQDCRSLC